MVAVELPKKAPWVGTTDIDVDPRDVRVITVSSSSDSGSGSCAAWRSRDRSFSDNGASGEALRRRALTGTENLSI